MDWVVRWFRGLSFMDKWTVVSLVLVFGGVGIALVAE